MSTFVVNLSAEPTALVAKNGEQALELVEVADKAAFDATEPEAGQAIYLYDETPNLNTYCLEGEGFADTEITTMPKLYVKFAEADVSQTTQTLTVEGFANAGELPNDAPNDALEAPVVSAVEDAITPTSISITWNAVEGATAYDLKVDGRAGVASDLTSFVHTGLAYDSTHTYQVRARNDECVSAWSDELEVRTAQDPWRNVPVPVTATLDYGPWGGYEEKYAFDHKTAASAGCMLSGTYNGTANGTGRALNLDYGLAYQFERLEYWPSNFGYVKKMQIETSLDGVHWTDQGTYDFTGSNEEVKILNFETPIVARCVRMLAVQTIATGRLPRSASTRLTAPRALPLAP